MPACSMDSSGWPHPCQHCLTFQASSSTSRCEGSTFKSLHSFSTPARSGSVGIDQSTVHALQRAWMMHERTVWPNHILLAALVLVCIEQCVQLG